MTIPLDQQNIIATLGIESLSDERKLELIDQASELVEKRILLRVLESFTPEQKDQFDNLLDAENPEAITQFIQSSTPDIADWVAEELAKVKQELASLAPLD